MNLISEDLNDKVVILVDYENIPFIPKELLLKDSIYYLFCGKKTVKTAEQYIQTFEDKDVYINASFHIGKNYVDNKLSMYIGFIFGRFKPKKVILVSNDKDYFEMNLSLMEHVYPFEIYKATVSAKKSKTVVPGDQHKVEQEVQIKSDVKMERFMELFKDVELISYSCLKHRLRKEMKIQKKKVDPFIHRLKEQGRIIVIKIKGKEEFYKIESIL